MVDLWLLATVEPGLILYREDRIFKQRDGCWHCILPYKGFLEIWTAVLRIQSVVLCPAHYVLLKTGISLELQGGNINGDTVSNNVRRKLTETHALNIRITSSETNYGIIRFKSF
jgi:hypothetical protein